MREDARFEDAGARPLNLGAREADDVQVISALVQDAVLTGADISWQPARRRLSLLINRFRWEDRDAAETGRRPYERVRALLVIDGVTGVASQGIDRKDGSAILSLLSLAWLPGKDAEGRLELTLAGDGAIAANVEYLELTLKDVTRPYRAPSGHVPHHPE
ncbi:MAG: DUF2948 family protein [Rhodobacteraceae bacterium]|nr:DUF2948 family protein [Paracoccaceae bacterium]